MLFNYKNEEGAKENYILMSNFIKYLKFYKIEGLGNDSDISKIDNSILTYSHSNSKTGFPENKLTPLREQNKSNYEMKYINEQYNKFNKDIIDILNNAKKSNINNIFNVNKKNKSKNFGASRMSIESKQKIKNNEEKKSKE